MRLPCPHAHPQDEGLCFLPFEVSAKHYHSSFKRMQNPDTHQATENILSQVKSNSNALLSPRHPIASRRSLSNSIGVVSFAAAVAPELLNLTEPSEVDVGYSVINLNSGIVLLLSREKLLCKYIWVKLDSTQTWIDPNPAAFWKWLLWPVCSCLKGNRSGIGE